MRLCSEPRPLSALHLMAHRYNDHNHRILIVSERGHVPVIF